jgi:chromosome transmission fidelity protein 4
MTEANPFTKKPNGAVDGSRNPFTRDGPNNKSLHKSESFFDKAEAAETAKWKGQSHPIAFSSFFLSSDVNKC